MKKVIFKKSSLLLILLAILLVMVLVGIIHRDQNKPKAVVEIGGHKFQAEIVLDQKQQEKGLGGRAELCPDCAMLFSFPNGGIHSFWMKDMRFNLDIIWISDGQIVYIARNVPYNSPDVITPHVASNQVLEINGGLVDKYRFQVGDSVAIANAQ